MNLHIANNEEDALNLFFEGETNRSISEHQLNKNSTRLTKLTKDHIVYLLYIWNRDLESNLQKKSHFQN